MASESASIAVEQPPLPNLELKLVPAGEGPIAGVIQAHSNFIKYLYEQHGAVVDENVQKAEQASGLKREIFAYVVIGLISIYLAFGGSAQFVCNFFAVAFGIFSSTKALRSGVNGVDLLAYWFVFGFFTLLDSGLNEVPLYFLLKATVLLFIALPETRGAALITQYVLQPAATLLGGLIGSQ